ncbi:MAG: DUF5677 domain-containing protein [Hyphomonadaceae bacterium]
MPKKRKQKKEHIKHAQYDGHTFSSLESHPRKGKNLSSPYRKLPNVSFSSWRDDFLPNMLWAAVLGTTVSRDCYLEFFRKILGQVRQLERPSERFLTHNYLAALTDDEFALVFAPLKESPEILAAMACLTLLDSLPDSQKWKVFLEISKPEKDNGILAKAVAATFDHQSELATDIRWLKVMTFIVLDRMNFGPQLGETLEEFRQYPNYGDMRKVRPSIRATEMFTRETEYGESLPKSILPFASEEFWVECRDKTECYFERDYQDLKLTTSSLMDELTVLANELSNHADDVAPHTKTDSKRDAAFGLASYAISLCLEAASSPIHSLAGGRILLRSTVEQMITLRYLSKKDDETIWNQYRNYGVGQAKLSFLKNVREEELPSFISLDNLHSLANEDTWMEFLDINVGPWENLNLRQMSEFADCKVIYDKYYSWASGFTHAHWAAVRDTVFATCWNPLHRFHRVLAPARQMPSVLDDMCRLINNMLDDVGMLYPSFKMRIKWHKIVKTSLES